MELVIGLSVTLEGRQPMIPPALREHDHAGAEASSRIDRVIGPGHRVQPTLEAARRAGANLRARLGVVGAVSFDEARLQCAHDHLGALVEALAGGIHLDAAEWLVLPARQASTHPEAHASPAELVQHRDLLRDTERLVPGHDHRRCAQIDALRAAREIAQDLGIVRAERVVEEVVLGRPQCVKAELLREQCEPELLFVDLSVRDTLPPVRREDQLQTDVHLSPPPGRSLRTRAIIGEPRYASLEPARGNA